jgi:hypothetical protein
MGTASAWLSHVGRQEKRFIWETVRLRNSSDHKRAQFGQADARRHHFPEIPNSGAEKKLIKMSALVSPQSRMTCTLKVTQND